MNRKNVRNCDKKYKNDNYNLSDVTDVNNNHVVDDFDIYCNKNRNNDDSSFNMNNCDDDICIFKFNKINEYIHNNNNSKITASFNNTNSDDNDDDKCNGLTSNNIVHNDLNSCNFNYNGNRNNNNDDVNIICSNNYSKNSFANDYLKCKKAEPDFPNDFGCNISDNDQNLNSNDYIDLSIKRNILCTCQIGKTSLRSNLIGRQDILTDKESLKDLNSFSLSKTVTNNLCTAMLQMIQEEQIDNFSQSTTTTPRLSQASTVSNSSNMETTNEELLNEEKTLNLKINNKSELVNSESILVKHKSPTHHSADVPNNEIKINSVLNMFFPNLEDQSNMNRLKMYHGDERIKLQQQKESSKCNELTTSMIAAKPVSNNVLNNFSNPNSSINSNKMFDSSPSSQLYTSYLSQTYNSYPANMVSMSPATTP